MSKQIRRSGVLTALMALVAAAPQAQPASADDASAIQAVLRAIEAKDCGAAATALNTALQGGTPAALLLGGSMFEQGVCLKPNLERAIRLYLRAEDAPGARSRLAGLYAAPAAGPDSGAALWWGLRAGLPLPAACQVPGDAWATAESFAKALAGWPKGRLEACVHVTGVLSQLDAEFQLAGANGQPGSLPVVFWVAQGKLDVNGDQIGTEGFEPGAGTGANRSSAPGFQRHEAWSQPDPQQQQDREAQRRLAQRVLQVGQRALSRYPRPAGVAADWRVEMRVLAERG